MRSTTLALIPILALATIHSGDQNGQAGGCDIQPDGELQAQLVRKSHGIAAPVDGVSLVIGIAEIMVFADFGQGIVFVVVASVLFPLVVSC